MFFLPDLIREKIDWYQWKSKMKIIINEYHQKIEILFVHPDFEMYFHQYGAINYRHCSYELNYNLISNQIIIKNFRNPLKDLKLLPDNYLQTKLYN